MFETLAEEIFSILLGISVLINVLTTAILRHNAGYIEELNDTIKGLQEEIVDVTSELWDEITR